MDLTTSDIVDAHLQQNRSPTYRPMTFEPMRSLTVGMGSPFTPSPLGSVSTDGELDRLYTSTSPFLAASVHEDGTNHTESMDSYMLDSADFDFKANLDAISVPMAPLDRAIGAPTIYTSAREFGPSDDCDYLGVESRWGTSGIASKSAPVLPTRSSKKPSTTGKQGVKQKRAVNQQQQQEKKQKKKKPSSPEESGGLFSSAVDPMISTNALHDFNWATKPTPTKSKAGKASRTKKASARRSSAPRNEYLPHAAVGQPFAPQSFKPHGSYAAALIPIFADAKDVWSQALAQVEVGRPSQPSSASQPASKNRLKLPKPSGRPTASSRSVSFKAPKAPKASKASKAKATAARLPSVRPSATLTAASPPTSHPSIWQPSPSEKQKKMENKKNKKIPMQPGTPAVHAAAAAVALSEIEDKAQDIRTTVQHKMCRGLPHSDVPAGFNKFTTDSTDWTFVCGFCDSGTIGDPQGQWRRRDMLCDPQIRAICADCWRTYTNFTEKVKKQPGYHEYRIMASSIHKLSVEDVELFRSLVLDCLWAAYASYFFRRRGKATHSDRIVRIAQFFWSDILGRDGIERSCFCGKAIPHSHAWIDCKCWNLRFRMFNTKKDIADKERVQQEKAAIVQVGRAALVKMVECLSKYKSKWAHDVIEKLEMLK